MSRFVQIVSDVCADKTQFCKALQNKSIKLDFGTYLSINVLLIQNTLHVLLMF